MLELAAANRAVRRPTINERLKRVLEALSLAVALDGLEQGLAHTRPLPQGGQECDDRVGLQGFPRGL